MTRRGSAIYPITIFNNEVLFLLGREDSYESSYSEYGKIAAFGGRADAGESLQQCAAREAFEELNGLYYTKNQWLDQIDSVNKICTVEYDESTAYFIKVPYDPLISQHFSGTRALLSNLREKMSISAISMIKAGFAEKMDVRWYTINEIKDLMKTPILRKPTKNTFNLIDFNKISELVYAAVLFEQRQYG